MITDEQLELQAKVDIYLQHNLTLEEVLDCLEPLQIKLHLKGKDKEKLEEIGKVYRALIAILESKKPLELYPF